MNKQGTNLATVSNGNTAYDKIQEMAAKFGDYSEDIANQLTFLAKVGDLGAEKHRLVIAQSLRWTPEQYMAMNPEAIEDIVKHADKFTSIRNIVKVWGMDAWTNFVIKMMYEVSEMVNVKNGITEKVMEALPVQFANDKECSQLTIPDLILCVKMGVRGKFGDDFNRLDVPTVFRWVNAYYKQRKSTGRYATTPTMANTKAERERKNAEARQKAIETICHAKTSDDYSKITAYHFDFLVKHLDAELSEDMIKERCQDEGLQEIVKMNIENDTNLSPMQVKDALRNIAGFNETVYLAKKDLAIEWIKENEVCP